MRRWRGRTDPNATHTAKNKSSTWQITFQNVLVSAANKTRLKMLLNSLPSAYQNTLLKAKHYAVISGLLKAKDSTEVSTSQKSQLCFPPCRKQYIQYAGNAAESVAEC